MSGAERLVAVKNPDAMGPLLALLDELLEPVHTAGRADLAGRLGIARARLSDPRVRLVVVGESKSGMSTLVNSLIGAAVSATDSTLSVPVIAEYGPQPTATLVRASRGGSAERQAVEPRQAVADLLDEHVIRAEITEPSALLAEGFVLLDAPGSPADTPATWSLLAVADAVLYVADAARPFTAGQIGQLQRIQQVCPTVVCVLNKIDQYPQWPEVQQHDRRLLDAAGLAFAVAPASARLHEQATATGDQQLDLESGVPQLLDHLRGYVLGNADAVAAEAAVRDIGLITDHLALALRTEAETLRDPRRYGVITEQLRRTREEAEQLRQRSANWQVTLADGAGELMADTEHDLRHRLRSLIRDAEADIMKRDPARRWAEFGADLDAKICEAVEENFVIAHYRSVELAEQVAAKFPDRGIPTPELRLDNPGEVGEVLEPVTALDKLDSAKPAVAQQFLNMLRGSYGGVLMVGLATSLLGMSLVNWYSAGAGVLLGINALWDDRKARKQRRQAEAKVAVARLMDDVIFQVSKESRYRLRAVQRNLRDHFTEIANETLRSVDASLRAAEEAAAVHSGQRREQRLTEIEASLIRLHDLRERADAQGGQNSGY
ncbi:dynamin family protein [Nocardia acidivorans]|uniref:dynamin family protein n=1 Tax=Nocardia acidivorans TaxID=404580 RepID=UPI000A4055F5|nr:dynamin family protein [Nocardia acidivorans]